MVLAPIRLLCFGIIFPWLFSLAAFANPYPPANQKRSPLVLQAHGIFWAGGEIVNRTQSGTENSGDLCRDAGAPVLCPMSLTT